MSAIAPSAASCTSSSDRFSGRFSGRSASRRPARWRRQLLGAALAATAAASAGASPLLFSGTGAAATTAFDAFRGAIGGGSRITWDGVRLDGSDVNPATQVLIPGSTVAIPENRFTAAGALFADPYAVAGDGFTAANPATAGQFPAFTPGNTFVMFDTDGNDFDDRFIEQSFVLPGTTTAAGTRGFGAIFVGVEQAGSSSIEYFGRNALGERISLGHFAVEAGSGPSDTQFLGVLFDAAIVADVVLTVGTHALFGFDGTTLRSFGAQTPGTDLAVTDDFVFARPEALVTVPEPPPLALGFAALGAALTLRRLRPAD